MHSSFKITLFLLLTVSLSLQAQTKKVLFIGNSYTGYNNLPQLVRDVALSVGDTLIYDAHTPGGQTLESHSTNTTALNKIAADDWDYVTLQEQSQRPSFPIGQVETEVFPYATSLCNSIRDNNPCTRPMFYMTWGRENGDSQNCPNWPPVCTYEGMDSLLNLRYNIMADDNEAYLSPVGAVWHYIRNNYPDIDLYASDGSHPSPAGSYAAACSFYTAIFQKDPSNISFNFSLSDTEANQIKEAARIVVFENLAEHNVGIYDPHADFTSSTVDNEVSFVNTSTLADSYLWGFGDGNTSTDQNPVHTYSTSGDFFVYLTAFNNCAVSSTDSMVVQVSVTSGLHSPSQKELRLYPNPGRNILVLEDVDPSAGSIKIFSLDGKQLKRQSFSSSIEIGILPKGIYSIQVMNEQGKVLQYGRFVKE